MAISARAEEDVVRGDGYQPGVRGTVDVSDLQREIEQLQEAVASRQRIGVVTGLLASRYGCTTDQAWALLVRISQATNTKVHRVCAVLQGSFDAAPLTPQQETVLAVVTAHLPPGGWPPHTVGHDLG